MDNNNFPNNPNLNQNNNQQPQQPFTPNGQPQQPFTPNAQPQQPFTPNPTPQQPNNNPFGGQNHQFTNPFASNLNNSAPGSDPSAHQKGLIATICGAASVLLNIISIIVFCSCVCNVGSLNSFNAIYSYAQNIQTGYIVSAIMVFVALAAAIVAIAMAAMGKKTSNDPLLTAGLVLGIVGAVLTFIMLIACLSSCACSACAASSASSSYSSLLNSLY